MMMTTTTEVTATGVRARTRRGWSVAALVTASALALHGCGNGQDGAGTGGATGTQQPGTGQQGKAGGGEPLQAADQEFLRNAAASNRAEIELAQLAQQQAQNDQVRELARMIEQDHRKAHEEVRQLADRMAVTVEDTMLPQHQQVQQRLQGMQGAAFDRAYAEAMVEEHRKDIEASTRASQSNNTEIRQYAERTLPALREHLQQAESVQAQGAGKAGTGKAGAGKTGAGKTGAGKAGAKDGAKAKAGAKG